jgi:hypothetical protein
MATKARKNIITGIQLDKLDRSIMEGAAKTLGYEIPPGSTDDQASVFLYGKFLEGAGQKADDFLVCENCGGGSPEGVVKDCPYCNDVGVVAGPPPVKNNPTPTSNDSGKAPKEEKAPPMTTQADKATAKADKQVSFDKPAAALATVTSIDKTLSKFTEKDLDKAVAKVQQLKSKSSEDYWNLGQEIGHIYKSQIWKLRNEDGKPRYRTVDAFVAAELGMTPPQAWKCMATAEAFTVEQVRAFGSTKLGLILEAPEEMRPQLQKAVEEGVTKRALEKEVRKGNKGRKTIKQRDGKVRKAVQDGVTKKGLKAKKTGPKPKAGRSVITVANITGVTTILLYKKGSQEGDDKKQWTRAKRIADQPTGSLELENAVIQTYEVTDGPDGCLKLRIKTERIEA